MRERIPGESSSFMKARVAAICTVLLSLALMFCQKRDDLSRIKRGDFSLVTEGSYHGRLYFLGDGGELIQSVRDLRGIVERDFDVLDLISNRFYEMPHFGYRFKYAAVDTATGLIMLRYFARIGEHPVYAGYEIQFLFDTESQKLKMVYTDEVPLE
jgi:hypothetical protein